MEKLKLLFAFGALLVVFFFALKTHLEAPVLIIPAQSGDSDWRVVTVEDERAVFVSAGNHQAVARAFTGAWRGNDLYLAYLAYPWQKSGLRAMTKSGLFLVPEGVQTDKISVYWYDGERRIPIKKKRD